MGQAIIVEVSLSEISAGAPTIVVARRIASEPSTYVHNETVTEPDGDAHPLSYEFKAWEFEVIDGVKHLYRSALPRRITVMPAYAEHDYEMLRESVMGPSLTYARERYVSESGLTLESVGAEPVILFLRTGAVRVADAPPEIADAFALYVSNSLEQVDRLDEVTELARQRYRPGQGPSPASESE